ncbi:MAG TPA: phospho-N-acetylmuramoyl-pentapeptide-transferase, partial [Gammaproteobacteria bacterium]|nr:phospho-N-acetylmuramoyl-pentapeptide-transferase [Gammaproteobacteria bacterium]
MLTYYFDTLAADYSFFNVFRYLTFRAVCAVLTALALSLLMGPFMIRRLASMRIGATIRNDGPTSHFEKSGTPTMGGGLIVFALVVTTLLWADLGNRFVWIAIATSTGFGVIGWMDDYQKLRAPKFSGLSAPNKFLLQSLVGFSAALVLYHTAVAPVETQLIVPFFKSIAIDLGMGFVVLAWFVIVGASNAVNLTDGLDGLAVLPSALVAGGLGVFAYVSGHAGFSGYLGIPHIVGAGEMMVFCAALVGAGLGFLW